MSEPRSIIDQLTTLWGGYEAYNQRLDEQVALSIAGRWYVAPARAASDLQHYLSVFGTCDDGKMIRFKEDTGLCGNQAIVTRPRPIDSVWGVKPVQTPPEEMLKFRWNPQAGQDGSRLFYGAFEQC